MNQREVGFNETLRREAGNGRKTHKSSTAHSVFTHGEQKRHTNSQTVSSWGKFTVPCRSGVIYARYL